jgi:hypothetical protein
MRNTIRIFVFAIPMLFAFAAHSQEQLNLKASCQYYGDSAGGQVWSFTSDKDAEAAVERVLDHTGLPQNFEVLRGNVPNAMAALQDNKRFIVYNQAFIEKIAETTNTDWSAVSILAHEIGHHLAGHTLSKDGSRPKTELEADRFSGHVLFKMGSTMADAKAAMIEVASEVGSDTHPPKSARIAAIESGWFDARDQSGGKQVKQPDPDPDPPKPNPPSPPKPIQQGPYTVAKAHFNDGGIAFIQSDNTIWANNNFGQAVQIAMKTASDNPSYAWYYVIQSTDANTETVMNMFGMSGTTTYGVDSGGGVWSVDLYGQCCVKIGQVYNQ